MRAKSQFLLVKAGGITLLAQVCPWSQVPGSSMCLFGISDSKLICYCAVPGTDAKMGTNLLSTTSLQTQSPFERYLTLLTVLFFSLGIEHRVTLIIKPNSSQPIVYIYDRF